MVAMVFAGCVPRWSSARYSPDGTEKQRIAVPTSFITSLGFRGDELSDLFVVSGMGNDREKFGPLAGATFAPTTDVRRRTEFQSRVCV